MAGTARKSDNGGPRIESDLLGPVTIAAECLHGVHTIRALQNFPLSGRPVHRELVHAYGLVKQACAEVNRELGAIPADKAKAIEAACRELAEGDLDAHVMVDSLQGGAGTSTNMNVNEVIANRALVLLGLAPGDYGVISPLDHVNLHQSTNDTYPTALKIASIRGLHRLEEAVIELLEAFQAKEKEFAAVVKVGRTEYQDAALITLGREMGAYADALARDRWRIYKCEERLRVINLGGTAIGTGLAAPRQFIFRAAEKLRELSGIGLARAENLVDNTQNADVFAEVSGILKALSVSLIKISNDLRLLSSGPEAGLGEIRLPRRQAGSSIMPGKVNPVIPEAVIQASIMTMANDQALTSAAAMGSLELNAFMPLIAECLLSSLDLLRGSCSVLARFCVAGIQADHDRCRRLFENSTAAATALLPALGYEGACRLIDTSRQTGKSIRETAIESGLLTAERFDELTGPEIVCRLGSPEPAKR